MNKKINQLIVFLMLSVFLSACSLIEDDEKSNSGISDNSDVTETEPVLSVAITGLGVRTIGNQLSLDVD